ncbi:hypothetical protein HDU97_008544 [Phlyctochytrium planicorne]|nr:hypothetical protein HDU97_008544 [Phlyctochytrium planicorne]
MSLESKNVPKFNRAYQFHNFKNPQTKQQPVARRKPYNENSKYHVTKPEEAPSKISKGKPIAPPKQLTDEYWRHHDAQMKVIREHERWRREQERENALKVKKVFERWKREATESLRKAREEGMLLEPISIEASSSRIQQKGDGANLASKIASPLLDSTRVAGLDRFGIKKFRRKKKCGKNVVSLDPLNGQGSSEMDGCQENAMRLEADDHDDEEGRELKFLRVLSLELCHGDLLIMDGGSIQKFYQHKICPVAGLRFALTMRTIGDGGTFPMDTDEATEKLKGEAFAFLKEEITRNSDEGLAKSV